MRKYEVSANFSISDVVKSDIRKFQKQVHRNMRRAVVDSMDYVKRKIAEYAPIVTGDLRKRILSIPVRIKGETGFDLTTGKSGEFVISLNLSGRSSQKIIWVNEGTGIFGPRGQPIVPKRGRFLIFKIGDRWIKTTVVPGQPGQMFIERGINASKAIIRTKIWGAIKRA